MNEENEKKQGTRKRKKIFKNNIILKNDIYTEINVKYENMLER